MKKFILYDYIYTNDDITYLQNLCKKVIWERIGTLIETEKQYNAEFIDENDGNRYVSTPERYLDPSKIIKAYLNYIPEYASSCLNDGFNQSKGYTADVKLSKYNKNDRYDWHCDYWEYHEQTKYWKRQLSSITYLNDDYDGGETEFEGGITIIPKVGKTVVFPSNWCFPHRGKIVTKGTKYIYVKHIWI